MEKLLEIGLYFDERINAATQEPMNLLDVADTLLSGYPLHLFSRKHHVELNHTPTVPRGLIMLYCQLLDAPHQEWLRQMKREGYIKSWTVFPPGTWQSYFNSKHSTYAIEATPYSSQY